MIAKTNTQHYQNIANEIRTANDYAAFKSEIEVDNELFEDIGEAIAEKDGGKVPERRELVERIGAIPFFDYDLPVEDNQIKMFVRIHPAIMNCYVNFYQTVAHGVEVDWGDSTSFSTSAATGQDRYSCASIAHNYSTEGYKTITLTVSQGSVSLIDSNGFISFAGADGNTNGNQFPNNYFRHSLIGIAFGNETNGNVGQCHALLFAQNVNGSIGGNTALAEATIRNSATVCPNVDGTSVRNIEIPSSIRTFGDNCFRNCTFLGIVDLSGFTVNDLAQCTFGSNLFTSATFNGLTILFKDQETAEYAKTITNLSVWADYIKYVGEVES